ncbi:MAG TPA: zinc ABC transporter substrate-binding protein, partial [Caldilineaceae bacterium]|nr:zinc ABC transporter substrate-binding protein [Caldilineaceae bacterium]
VTTTSMITNIVEIVGGEQVDVHGLMGAGIDPHLYVASEGDVELLQNADIIFYNGLFLEAQMDEILKQIGERKPAVAVAEHIEENLLLPWAAYADEFDPHVWFDVTLWMKAVEAVRDTLVEQDPAHAATYQASAAAYLQELETLDGYVKEQAATVPAEQRVLITAHDAFHYFGRAYGFDVRGLQGISTASEAGTADVRALADFIVEHEIRAIFVESSVPVRNVEALQAAVKDRGFEVIIGGQLFSDAMGNPGTPEGAYAGMVRHNIDTIVKALLG